MNSTIQILLSILYVTITTAVIIAGHKFKGVYLILIVVSYPIIETLHLVNMRMDMQVINDGIKNADDCEKSLFDFRKLGHEFFYTAGFLCPSFEVLVFWYVPTLVVKFQIILYGSDVVLFKRVSENAVVAAIGIFLYYMVTSRDLKRFF